MIQLSRPQSMARQYQIGEALAHIAQFDFHKRWPSLLEVSYIIRAIAVAVVERDLIHRIW
jgi:hypothetical protein